MRALYIHISGLVGLLVFLKEVLNYAPIERTILVAATTGLTVYLMLIVGHSIVQRIMAYSPPAHPSSGGTQHTAPPERAVATPEAQAGALSAGNASARAADAEASSPTNAPAGRDDAGEEPDAGNAAPSSSEPNDSAPDRAARADRADAESSEPVAQTPA